MPVLEPLPVDDGEGADMPVMSQAQLDAISQMNGINQMVDDLVAGGMSFDEAYTRAHQEVGITPQAVIDDTAGQAPAAAQETEVRRATPALQNEGSFFDLNYINDFRQAYQQALQQTGDPAKAVEMVKPIAQSWSPAQRHVYERTEGYAEVDPKYAAGLAQDFYKMQEERAKVAGEQNDPAKRVDTATKQAEVQEAYRQEIEYQRSLTTLNDESATSAQKRAARMQIEALSAGIGKRINPKLGTSAAAMNEAKNAVGYIGAYEYNNPLADFGSRISTMQRNSQERLGLLRQQMDASGMPVPDIKPAEAATQEDMRAKTSDMVMSMAGVKDQSGNAVMIGGSPVIKVPEAGKLVYKKRGPGGGWINLTQEEAALLGAQ